MKSIIFINFVLGVLVSTAPSTPRRTITVSVLTNYVLVRYEKITVLFGELTPVENSMQPGFELNIVNTPVPATGIVCQAFKDAAGTDLLGLPFGGQERYQAQISNHPYPVHIGSLICSDEEGVQAQIKRAQKSGGIIGVRSSPAGPEPVDGTQIAVEKAMPNPDPITIDTWEKRDFEVEPIESMEEMEADDEFYRGQSGAVNRPEEEKPAPSPYWNGVTSSWVYPDNP